MATTENLMDIDIGVHTAVEMNEIITGKYFGLKLLNSLLPLLSTTSLTLKEYPLSINYQNNVKGS